MSNIIDDAVQKLCKWRMVFAGWQLGTRSIDDAECQAVRDHREVTILMRAELSALIMLMVKKNIFTAVEFAETVGEAALLLDKDYESKFPGFTTSLMGVSIDLNKAKDTMKGWRP